MKCSTTTKTIIAILAALASATTVPARPTDFSEVSLWVRARETDRSIVHEVSQRKLIHPLTPQQEATLKAQGASDSLVQSLRGSSMIASPAEVAASEVKSQTPRTPSSRETASDSAASNLQIVEVAAGHSINLSEWGGPDSEFAFDIWRCAGEDVVGAEIIDTARTYTDVGSYVGPGFRPSRPSFRSKQFTPYLGVDLEDNSYLTDPTYGYASAMSHYNFHRVAINKRNPVLIKDVPYTLYPIRTVRGVSLYYIGNTSNSVTLAVDTSGR